MRWILAGAIVALTGVPAGAAPPIELARSPDVLGIAGIAGGEIVLTTATAIATVSTNGGGLRPIASLSDDPSRRLIFDAVVDERRVYWIAASNDAVWAVDRRPGAVPRRIVRAPRRVLSSLIVHGGSLVFQEHADREAVTLVAVDRRTLRRRVLARKLDSPTPLAAFDGRLYWAEGSRVYELPVAGGAPRVVATETAKASIELRDPADPGRIIGTREETLPITAVFVDASDIYWTGPEGTRRIPKGGGPITALPRPIDPAAQDAAAFYVRKGHQLVRIPKDGAAPQLLAEVTGELGTVALDGKTLFFTVYTRGTGTVLLRLEL